MCKWLEHLGKMQDLSVVIVAQDEERTIKAVLNAVKEIASEIILVDSGSSDKTVEISRACGAVCHYRKWHGYADQKNFAISLAKSSWILSLDADEVLTEPLVAEIRDLLSSPLCDQFSGFTMPRILYIGDTPLGHGGFYPDAQLRLFKQGQGQFNDRIVHEAIKVKGKVGKLKNPMRHYAYPDLAAFAQAMDKYARLSAQEFSKGFFNVHAGFANQGRAWRAPTEDVDRAIIGTMPDDPNSGRMQCAPTGVPEPSIVGIMPDDPNRVNAQCAPTGVVNPAVIRTKTPAAVLWRKSVINEWLHPCWTFFHRYIIRAGFLDGVLGLKANLIYCDYVRKKIAYLRDDLAKTS